MRQLQHRNLSTSLFENLNLTSILLMSHIHLGLLSGFFRRSLLDCIFMQLCLLPLLPVRSAPSMLLYYT